MSDIAPWITYRPQLKVLDCTIRDGGLINDHRFSDELVRAVYDACVAAGVDYMEIGYKGSLQHFSREKYGDWKFCEEQDLRRVVPDHSPATAGGLKLCVMADAGKCDWKTQIGPKKDSVIDVVRVACYVHQIPEAVEMIHHAHEHGYETWCNLMAISTVQEVEVDQALQVIAQTPATAVAVVDSFGSLYREQIDHLVKKYQAALAPAGKEVGIHAHNNMQLAFANTIEAIILGANRADATMAGLGRGAGNCPMELLLGFLRNPKFKLRPVLALLQDHFLKLRESVEWGPLIPYNLTGLLNRHPRAAMKCRAGKEPDNYVGFYDQITSEE
jgi:4-hydroxy 2-oxovalerate aldolase